MFKTKVAKRTLHYEQESLSVEDKLSVADLAARGGGGKEKHEIYAAAFSSHLFMTYFYSAKGVMALSRPQIRY